MAQCTKYFSSKRRFLPAATCCNNSNHKLTTSKIESHFFGKRSQSNTHTNTHTHVEDGFFLTILPLLLGLHKRLVKSMCSGELRIDFEFYCRNRFNCHGSRTLFYFHYSYFSSSISISTFIYSYILRSFFYFGN